MTRTLYNLVARIRNLVVHEFPLALAAVVAALTAATGSTPKGYAVAAGIALLRFGVSPAFQATALRAKILPPTIDEIVAAKVEAALRAYDAAHPASVAPSTVAVDPAPVSPPAAV